MSLISQFSTPCVMLVATTADDGEGGTVTTWAEGKKFSPAIVKNKDTLTTQAERDTAVDTYTVTISKTLDMPFHSVFKRKSDGRVLRVTSDQEDTQTPACASFSFKQVQAEEWELPDD